MKTIMEMAHEAGIIHPEMVNKPLERFAALVASAEREACAKLCEDSVDIEHWQDEKSGGIRTGLHAKLIRARGEA